MDILSSLLGELLGAPVTGPQANTGAQTQPQASAQTQVPQPSQSPVATTPPVASQTAPATTDPNAIVVNADKPQAPAMAPPPQLPSSISMAAQPVDGAPDVPQNVDASNLVNGPFKTHGVLGDILGHVMDMVLVNGGLKPEYGPRLQAAKEGNAVAPLLPQEFGALAHVDPTQALKTYNDDILNLQRVQQTTNERAEIPHIQAQTVEASGNTYAKGVTIYAQMASALAKNPALASQLIPQMEKVKRGYGLGSTYGIQPDENGNIDPQQAAAFATSGTTMTAQTNAGLRQQQIDNTQDYHDKQLQVAQQNADAHTEIAGKVGNRVTNPTNASIAAPLIKKIEAGQTLSPGEQEVLERSGFGTTTKPKPGTPVTAPAAAPAAGSNPIPGLPPVAGLSSSVSPHVVASQVKTSNGQPAIPRMANGKVYYFDPVTHQNLGAH